ncbi:MAG: hypothetical protein LBD53_02690 [Tannerella sp.]|jgi:hypothetical protein|nr:hypothetical protein [Tannerella sp.]
MNNKRLINTILGVIFALLAFSACDGMTDNYKQYVESGEKVYPAKANFVQAFSGKNRIRLQWLITSDPSITSAVIYWNNKRDSKNITVNRTSGVDTVSVMLDNMPEQTYNFEIYSTDADGNKSVAAQIIGTVYGDKYRNTLLNRAIQKIEATDDGDLNIVWGSAETGNISQTVIYTDNKGNKQTVEATVNNSETLLEAPDFDKSFIMATVFMPDSFALDTFMVTAQTVSFTVQETSAEIDRSKFSVKDLPGDHSENNNATNSLDRIWTNDYGTAGTPFISKAWALTACDDLVPFPYWFTIDMGAAYNISELTLYQRGGADLYKNSNLKLFEIWGAAEVDENYNPNEHNNVFDDNWILLSQCEIVPPTDAGTWAAVAAEGHTYDLRVNGQLQNIRYLRIKAIDNWQPLTGTCPTVKKRTYINIAAIKLIAVQRIVIF